MKTYEDLATNYNLILFNKCIELEDGAVLDEYIENKPLQEEEEEVFQWYLIGINETDKNYLNETYNLDIFYSETLNQYILPIYHYGTAWNYVYL